MTESDNATLARLRPILMDIVSEMQLRVIAVRTEDVTVTAGTNEGGHYYVISTQFTTAKSFDSDREQYVVADLKIVDVKDAERLEISLELQRRVTCSDRDLIVVWKLSKWEPECEDNLSAILLLVRETCAGEQLARTIWRLINSYN